MSCKGNSNYYQEWLRAIPSHPRCCAHCCVTNAGFWIKADEEGIYCMDDQWCLPLRCSVLVQVLQNPHCFQDTHSSAGSAPVQEQSLNASCLVIQSWGWLCTVLKLCELDLQQGCSRYLWVLFIVHGGQCQGEKDGAENQLCLPSHTLWRGVVSTWRSGCLAPILTKASEGLGLLCLPERLYPFIHPPAVYENVHLSLSALHY